SRRLVPEHEVPRRRRDRRLRTEQGCDMVLRAPKRWRLHAGWRRNMLADGLEQAADEALRRPAREADLAAAPADTEQLRRGLLVIRRKHDAKRRKHDVKAGGGER